MVKVMDIMNREVRSIAPTSSIFEAAKKLKAENIGSLPVALDSRLIGTITDRDITIRVTAEGRDPHETLVRDAMSSDMVVVRPQQELAEAERLMHDYQLRRLPVVELDGRLVGYLTMATIAKRDPDEKAVGRVLRGVSQPQRPAPEKSGSRSRGKTES